MRHLFAEKTKVDYYSEKTFKIGQDTLASVRIPKDDKSCKFLTSKVDETIKIRTKMVEIKDFYHFRENLAVFDDKNM